MNAAQAAKPSSHERTTAAREWVAEHGDYLYRFALAKVRIVDVAEDLVQDTLLAAWQSRLKYSGESSVRTWLTAILKRKVIDWYRRRVREHQQIESNADEERFAFDPFTRWGKWKAAPNSWKFDPAEGLNRSDFWAAFSACLAKLPSRMHDAFILRYLEEETGEAVCQEMKLTATNLWVILHRARLQMWKCLSISCFENQLEREERPC